MLLIIHNLPFHTRYADVKALIKSKCGLTEIILDNLVNVERTKKVTIGLAKEEDADLVVKYIDGLYVDKHRLNVECIGQKKPSQQSYYSSSNKPPRDNMEQPNQYQMNPPMGSQQGNSFPTGAPFFPQDPATMMQMMNMYFMMQQNTNMDNSNQVQWQQGMQYSQGSGTYNDSGAMGSGDYCANQNTGYYTQNSDHSNSDRFQPSERSSQQLTDPTSNTFSKWQNNSGDRKRCRSPSPEYPRNSNYSGPSNNASSDYNRKSQRDPDRNSDRYGYRNNGDDFNPHSDRNQSYVPSNEGLYNRRGESTRQSYNESQTSTRSEYNKKPDQWQSQSTAGSSNKQNANEWYDYRRSQAAESTDKQQSNKRSDYSQGSEPYYKRQRPNSPDRRTQQNTRPAKEKQRIWESSNPSSNNNPPSNKKTAPVSRYPPPANTNAPRPYRTWDNPPQRPQTANKPGPSRPGLSVCKPTPPAFKTGPPAFKTGLPANKTGPPANKPGPPANKPGPPANKPEPSEIPTKVILTRTRRGKPTPGYDGLLRRDESWRNEATARIRKEMALTLKVPPELNAAGVATYFEKTLKAAIHTRIDLLLKGELGVHINDIVMQYRNVFPLAMDGELFNGVVENVRKDKAETLERLKLGPGTQKDQATSTKAASSTEVVAKSIPASDGTAPSTSAPATIKADADATAEVIILDEDNNTKEEGDSKPQNIIIPKKAPMPDESLDYIPLGAPLTIPQLMPQETISRLPKYPMSSKKEFSAQKKLQKLEFTEEDMYSHQLDPLLSKAVEEQMEIFSNLYKDTIKKLMNAADKQEVYISEKLMDDALDSYKKSIKINLVKRLLDIRTNLVVRMFMTAGKPPNKDELDSFLKAFGVVSMHKPKGRGQSWGYWANITLDTYEHYDQMIKMGSANLNTYINHAYTPVGVTWGYWANITHDAYERYYKLIKMGSTTLKNTTLAFKPFKLTGPKMNKYSQRKNKKLALQNQKQSQLNYIDFTANDGGGDNDDGGDDDEDDYEACDGKDEEYEEIHVDTKMDDTFGENQDFKDEQCDQNENGDNKYDHKVEACDDIKDEDFEEW